ncbi:ThuA domain-containing protein [Mucilaginibacter sp.]|uniref:ThuA domain-containing protein n=1 Tax=Mucilaginibacter sp. TaxID=1882438 RepID=UPI00262AFA13|nr:ThuA domain-containing protein [Mucilaginibacter sp.]MDB5032281.1 ThuA protein [Mucilaginibacter sp.]
MRNQLKINRLISYLALCAVAILISSCGASHGASKKKDYKVLIYCKTAGFHHGSIKAGIAAIQKMGAENGFAVDSTVNESKFTDDNLKQYSAIIFLSTTGDFFKKDESKAALKNYIEHGGGYVGIHAATDAEYNWQWYGDLSGGYFKGHPGGTPLATLDVVDSTSIATKHLPRRWTRKDEWYHYKFIAKDLHVLIKLDETSFKYEPKDEKLKMGADHPLAWYHDFDGGRSFYTELGHTDETYSDPLFLQHLLGGIEYAMGRKKMQK